MPKTAFLLVEVGVYVLAIGCLRHAWIHGRSRLLGLATGMIYGVLLEYGALAAASSIAAYQEELRAIAARLHDLAKGLPPSRRACADARTAHNGPHPHHPCD
jgi:hypothetical protein